MQMSDEYAQEMTYAGQAAAREDAYGQQGAAAPQHVILDEQPADRAAEIYSFITLVAERCQEARITRVNEVNHSAGGTA